MVIALCKYPFCIITATECPINGQLYSLEAPDCVATCSDPYPTCSGQTKEGCDCPKGTVMDEIENKCVPLSKCSKNLITDHKSYNIIKIN